MRDDRHLDPALDDYISELEQARDTRALMELADLLSESGLNEVQRQRQAVKDTFRGMGA